MLWPKNEPDHLNRGLKIKDRRAVSLIVKKTGHPSKITINYTPVTCVGLYTR